jgi:hypothetical protein
MRFRLDQDLKRASCFVLGLVLACSLAASCGDSAKDTGATSAAQPTTFPASTGLTTFAGFITSEDDFVDPQIGADPSKDTRGMILMLAMARSGLGLAVNEPTGWKFYYFSGQFATQINPAFNGSGGQLAAWNIVLNTKKQDHISVTVTGTLDGSSATNPSGDADGIYYPVIQVESMAED